MELESKFTLPQTMIEYNNFASFLKEQNKPDEKEDNLIQQLFGIESSQINMSMFFVPKNINQHYLKFDIPETWEGIHGSETGQYEINKAFEKLRRLSSGGKNIYPLEVDIFRAFKLCKRTNLKVVILGQDPYPDFDQKLNLPTACGLAFSGRKNGKTPGSLENIFTEIRNTFLGIPLNHYDLTSWAEQGVLLLNTCLTVNHGDPESHINERVWNFFIDYLLKTLSEEHPGLIFCLWGSKAKAYANGSGAVISKKRTYVLESGHPSTRNSSGPQFIGNGHFAQIYNIIEHLNKEIDKKNIELIKNQKEPLPHKEQINWALV